MDLNERIMKAKANDVQKAVDAQNTKDAHLKELLEQIKVLTPRITKLIDTANTLIDNGYDSFIRTDSDNSYRGFQTEGWAHHFGFYINHSTGKVDSVGICNGGACGDFDFHTTGETTYMTSHNKGLFSNKEIKVSNAERMLKDFDDFENRFYTELDKFLSKKGA